MNFSYAYSPEIWPALITLAIVIYLGVYSWRRRRIPAAKPFTMACLLGVFWALGVILELTAADFSTKVFWIKFQVIWQLPIAASITCFILQYAGLGRWLNRRTYALLFLIPLLSAVLMVTNEFHHLIWAGFRMNGYAIASPGRLYWHFISYAYLLGLVNFAVLVWLAISSPGYRLPVAIIISGQFFARIGYAMDKLDLVGPGESLLLTVGVVSVAYAVALLRFHAIDPVASARTAALQQMRDGFIVLDLQGRIVDANPMAAKMLGIPENQAGDKRLEDLLPMDQTDLRKLEAEGAGQTDITMGKGNPGRQYRLSLTALRGRHGDVIGRLLMLHDVTEQKRAQMRILEQKTVVATLQERERLARELHDGIGQTLGYVSIQTQSALKWLYDGNKEKAGSLLERLNEVAKDAHADIRESIFNLKTGSDKQWFFIPALKGYLNRFQANYGLRTELSLSDGIDENTFNPETGFQLLRVIQEALTNSRKHGRADNLRIFIERDATMARISITDDGQGFDNSKLDRDDEGHFGLVFMRERVAQIGGSLKIKSMPGEGTLVSLDVPIATH